MTTIEHQQLQCVSYRFYGLSMCQLRKYNFIQIKIELWVGFVLVRVSWSFACICNNACACVNLKVKLRTHLSTWRRNCVRVCQLEGETACACVNLKAKQRHVNTVISLFYHSGFGSILVQNFVFFTSFSLWHLLSLRKYIGHTQTCFASTVYRPFAY